MPSHDPEIYKDKIEVSLDGRQIFYLFFGGSVIVGLVFVLGVMVGRRVEARGHLDRADTQATSDPLAALDRLERPDNLSFHGALTGAQTPTDVEKAIGELERRRAVAQAGKVTTASQAGKPEKGPPPVSPIVLPEKPPAAASAPRPEGPAPASAATAVDSVPPMARAEPVVRPDPDRPRGDKHDGDKRDGDKRDGDKRPRKHDDGSAADARSDHSDAKKPANRGEPVTRPEGRSDARASSSETHDVATDARKPRFTLQLSSFQDRSEAEAFLSTMKSAGFQPYLTEADVTGKGTFYRVRLGSYRSLEAANDAKAEYEKTARKSAQVMRL